MKGVVGGEHFAWASQDVKSRGSSPMVGIAGAAWLCWYRRGIGDDSCIVTGHGGRTKRISAEEYKAQALVTVSPRVLSLSCTESLSVLP